MRPDLSPERPNGVGAIGQTDGRQDRCLNKFQFAQQDFIPFGAAAQKITENANTPLSDRNVAKRRYITPKLFIVISFFFFSPGIQFD